MPSTLKRSRRRELTLTRSFTNAIQDKVHPDQRLRIEGRERRPFLIDRTNGCSHVTLASTPEAANAPALTSRPSMALSLYHSPNPDVPVHPIHLLPPELLMHVFVLGCLDDVMFPVLVSHVCHSWRAIALHAHSLWRRVSLNPRSRQDMWKERIRRARLCTLDVAFKSDPCLNLSHDIDTLTLQMHLLAPRVSTLRSLDIRFDTHKPYLWNAALGPLCRPSSYLWDHRSPNPGDQYFNGPIEAVKLESLILQYPQNDDTKQFTLFGGFAPKLRRLTLDGVRLTWIPELFGNLTYLDYTHHGFSSGQEAIEEILSMLQVSSQIRVLRLCFLSKVMERQVLHLQARLLVDEVVTLPFLESLSLHVDGAQADISSELTSIVSRLSVPDLRKLCLLDSRTLDASWSPNRNGKSFAGLHAFVDGLYPRLERTSLMHLTAEGRWVKPSLLSKLSENMTSLKTVTVNSVTRVVGFTASE
ncbi:hypothetical protein HYDPIDRAFT_132401 [Hydnomerulius pinastri MD-312]|uniref:F-box domain-containing protein n=1 Tax=Hydnomerulius pinastri MD-312 TaxID=994086 RepID=A0A0C9VFY7_9AGAM|nr:hypothetical protein HYDPIDRAFT_132401 [Hydnomerulius pinastri MD-312]